MPDSRFIDSSGGGYAPAQMKAVVLLNQKAGTLAASRQDDADRVRETFQMEGIEAQVLSIPGPELTLAARNAALSRPDAVVAGGGDGTQSSVAAGLAQTGVAMGVLPLGTLNHFAKDLGIPMDVEGAVKVIATGQVRKVDLGQVNGRTFINNSSIGIYPQIVRDRESQRQRLGRGKWLAMFFAAINAMKRFPTVRLRIEGGDQAMEHTTPFVFIGNNQYHMDLFSVRGRTRLDGGKLSLYVACRTGRFGMLRLAIRAILGTIDQDKDFESMSLDQVWIETRKKHLHVAIDGEVRKIEPPLHYKTLPGALNVLAPSGGPPA